MTDNSQNGGSQNNGVSFGREAEAKATTKGPIIPKSPNEALRPERVPQPPRRSRKARSQLVIFLNFVINRKIMQVQNKHEVVVCFVIIIGNTSSIFVLDDLECTLGLS